MGQYALKISFEKSISIGIQWSSNSLTILLPFIKIFFGFDQYAKGVKIFNKYYG